MMQANLMLRGAGLTAVVALVLSLVGVCHGAVGPKFEKDSPLDLTFDSEGAAVLFTATRGQVVAGPGTLDYAFSSGSTLSSPSLEGSRNSIYNPPLERWNTFFVVMENASTASQLRLSFVTTESQTYDAAKSKIFDIVPQSAKRGYYFNLSDVPAARGQLLGFQFEPLNGSGMMRIDRIGFEEEFQIEPLAGKIKSCKTTGTSLDSKITIQGSILPEYMKGYSRLAIYETAMYHETDDIRGLSKLYEGPIARNFKIKGIPLARGTNGMSRLSSQFLAVVQNERGQWLKVAPRFYIENWRDFEENPYAFKIPSRKVKVTDFGARGDGFSDDTAAIQRAIDAVAERGGGRVIFPCNTDSPYGQRYVASHIVLRSNTELHLEAGTVLWQTQNPGDYPYEPTYGHDTVIPDVPWTHCMHVSNLPLLYGKSVQNVKITGYGKIRSHAPYCLYPGYEHYAKNCEERIHVIPIGMWDCRNIEVTDVEIVRANNYHTAFYACENIFIGNIKMHEVRCVSGDGMSLRVGTYNVKIVRVFLESNDDGVVLCSSYDDPRGLLWWWAKPWQDNSIRNITACHSYLNSGGGKAISLLTWGTDNPNLEHQEIYNITVYDNVLQGGFSVGSWFDNPFNGKKPFDNTETDDYCPVKCFRIYDNEYRSPCDLMGVKTTDFITDCGLHSAGDLINADFKFGHCYWTMKGEAGVRDGVGFASKGGRLYEGLWLTKGVHTLSAEVQGEGRLFIEGVGSSEKEIRCGEFSSIAWKPVSVDIEVQTEGNYDLGIEGNGVWMRNVKLIHQ